LLTLLPAFWFIKRIFYIELYMFYRFIDRFRLKPNRYCQAIREVYRCFSLPNDKIKALTWEKRMMLRDLVCMVLEFDNAYRFRVQDLVEELDKQAFERNPIKELRRLMNIGASRENNQEVRDFWTLMKMSLNYLYLDREIKKVMVQVISNLNIEQVKLTIEDKHYCFPRKDYNFGFSLRGEAVE
jgi:hypothetical protein